MPTSSAVHHNELTAAQCAPVPGTFHEGNKNHGGPIWIVRKPSTRGCSSLILPRFFFQHQKFLVCMMLFRCILENPIGNSWQPMGKSTCQYTRRNDSKTNIQNEKKHQQPCWNISNKTNNLDLWHLDWPINPSGKCSCGLCKSFPLGSYTHL